MEGVLKGMDGFKKMDLIKPPLKKSAWDGPWVRKGKNLIIRPLKWILEPTK